LKAEPLFVRVLCRQSPQTRADTAKPGAIAPLRGALHLVVVGDDLVVERECALPVRFVLRRWLQLSRLCQEAPADRLRLLQIDDELGNARGIFEHSELCDRLTAERIRALHELGVRQPTAAAATREHERGEQRNREDALHAATAR